MIFRKSFILLGLALYWLTGGISQAQGPAVAVFQQGVELGAQGKFSEARAALEQALKDNPQFNPARNCLGVLEDIQNRRIKEQTGLHLFKAFALFNRFKTDDAIQELNRAAELDSNYSLIYQHRADAWADKKQWPQAMADYHRALEIDPRYAPGYLHRGIAYAVQLQYDKAIADFGRALEINPPYTAALYNRGNAYAQTGKYDQAIADYNRLLEIDPRYGHAYIRKGMALEKAGRPQDALSAYKGWLQNAADRPLTQFKFVEDKIKSLEK